MIDIFDMIHYLIGFIILGFLIWLLIQTHNYFSKDNIQIETLINKKKLN
jgi:large-conductance mechanosensitive channel